MARNGSGGYALPINGWNPAVNGVSATPADWQALIDDVAAAIQASIAADGQTPMTGNLQMGGYRLTGAGAPSGAGQSLRWEQLTRGADIPSAATIAIPLEGQLFAVTGSTAITAINATIAGRLAYLKLDAGIVLTHSASLLMPSGVNVTTGADDIAVFVSVSAGVWRCVSYPRFESANYPSATEPTITWPLMTWADTGNMLLKRRNAAGTAWVVEGVLTGFPAFSAYPTAIQTISSGVETLMTFGAEEFDTHGYYDATTFRFTPQIAGVYQINAGAFFASPAPTLSYLAVYKNSGAHKIGNQGPLQNATLSALIQMNGTTDYLNLYAQQTSGGLKNIGTGSSLCYFQAVLVRPA